ncbi:MAG: hypothetical protein OXD34_01905 [bacterium]|nr:hypothetical protein [bacterium]
MMLTLLGAAVATLAGWFVFNSLWMILIHLIVDAVFAWYITMLRRIRTFREDVEALVAEHDGDLPPTRESPTLRLVQPR